MINQSKVPNNHNEKKLELNSISPPSSISFLGGKSLYCQYHKNPNNNNSNNSNNNTNNNIHIPDKIFKKKIIYICTKPSCESDFLLCEDCIVDGNCQSNNHILHKSLVKIDDYINQIYWKYSMNLDGMNTSKSCEIEKEKFRSLTSNDSTNMIFDQITKAQGYLKNVIEDNFANMMKHFIKTVSQDINTKVSLNTPAEILSLIVAFQTCTKSDELNNILLNIKRLINKSGSETSKHNEIKSKLMVFQETTSKYLKDIFEKFIIEIFGEKSNNENLIQEREEQKEILNEIDEKLIKKPSAIIHRQTKKFLFMSRKISKKRKKDDKEPRKKVEEEEREGEGEEVKKKITCISHDEEPKLKKQIKLNEISSSLHGDVNIKKTKKSTGNFSQVHIWLSNNGQYVYTNSYSIQIQTKKRRQFELQNQNNQKFMNLLCVPCDIQNEDEKILKQDYPNLKSLYVGSQYGIDVLKPLSSIDNKSYLIDQNISNFTSPLKFLMHIDCIKGPKIVSIHQQGYVIIWKIDQITNKLDKFHNLKHDFEITSSTWLLKRYLILGDQNGFITIYDLYGDDNVDFIISFRSVPIQNNTENIITNPIIGITCIEIHKPDLFELENIQKDKQYATIRLIISNVENMIIIRHLELQRISPDGSFQFHHIDQNKAISAELKIKSNNIQAISTSVSFPKSIFLAISNRVCSYCINDLSPQIEYPLMIDDNIKHLIILDSSNHLMTSRILVICDNNKGIYIHRIERDKNSNICFFFDGKLKDSINSKQKIQIIRDPFNPRMLYLLLLTETQNLIFYKMEAFYRRDI